MYPGLLLLKETMILALGIADNVLIMPIVASTQVETKGIRT
jgi:hypothetical protein